MSSKIEQMIDQIEDFIDSCRYQTFSKTITTSASSPTRKRSLRTPEERPTR